jgi:hypothetical protein
MFPLLKFIRKHQAMKEYGGSGDISLQFLPFEQDGGECLAAHPGHLTPEVGHSLGFRAG